MMRKNIQIIEASSNLVFEGNSFLHKWFCSDTFFVLASENLQVKSM